MEKCIFSYSRNEFFSTGEMLKAVVCKQGGVDSFFLNFIPQKFYQHSTTPVEKLIIDN